MSVFLPEANEFGNIDVQKTVPQELTHVKGPRLQPLCRKFSILYANALIGWGGSKRYPQPLLDGVVVQVESASVLIRAIAERDKRSAKRKAQENRKNEERLAREMREAEDLNSRLMQEQRYAFIQRFPAASEATIEKYAYGFISSYDSFDDVPINKLTEQEIQELELAQEAQCGVVLTDNGSTITPLFSARIPKNETNETPEQVHRRAIEAGFPVHKALWAVNKIVKLVTFAPKREVYDLKDKLLRHWADFLIEGRIARNENRECWDCDGTGEGNCGDDCYHCDGTGINTSNTLYESRYQFTGDERLYCYHGYSKPEKLSNQPGADKKFYGHRFTREERKSIPFAFHELMKMLQHEITLLEKAAKLRERDDVLQQWNEFGLPPIRPEVATSEIRKCLTLIMTISVR